jgi:hypothetical protein
MVDGATLLCRRLFGCGLFRARGGGLGRCVFGGGAGTCSFPLRTLGVIVDIEKYFNFGLAAVLLLLGGGGLWVSGTRTATWLAEKFLSPLGGEEGLVARFFTSQIENTKRQTELMAEQKVLVGRLTDNIQTLSNTQQAHYRESTHFYEESHISQLDLIRIHGLLAEALSRVFREDAEAIKLLQEIDEIVKDNLRSMRQPSQ